MPKLINFYLITFYTLFFNVYSYSFDKLFLTTFHSRFRKQYRDRLPNVVSATGQPMVNKMATYISGSALTGNNNNKPQSGQGANTVERQTGVENPVFNMSDNNYQGTIHRGQLPPAPSEVSAWQANGTLKDEHPMGNFSSRPGSGLSNGKVQNIYWPNGSIPRRVKKLSWEDEQPNRVKCK